MILVRADRSARRTPLAGPLTGDPDRNRDRPADRRVAAGGADVTARCTAVWPLARRVPCPTADLGCVSRTCRAGPVLGHAGAVSPRRAAGSDHPDAPHHVLPDAYGDPVEQLARQGAQLRRPGRRLGLQHELAVAQRERRAVVGDVRADELRPAPEDRRIGQPGRPATVQGDAGDQPAERLRVAIVGTRPRPPAAPAPRPAHHARPLGRPLGGAGGRGLACRPQRLPREIRPSGARIRPVGRGIEVCRSVRVGMFTTSGRSIVVPRPGDNSPGFARGGRSTWADGRSFLLLITSRAEVVHSIHNLVHNPWVIMRRGADVGVCGRAAEQRSIRPPFTANRTPARPAGTSSATAAVTRTCSARAATPASARRRRSSSSANTSSRISTGSTPSAHSSR